MKARKVSFCNITFTPKLAISTLRQSANASSPRFDTLYAPMFRQLKKEKILDMYTIRPVAVRRHKTSIFSLNVATVRT